MRSLALLAALPALLLSPRSACATATYHVANSVKVTVKSLDAGVIVSSINFGTADTDFFGEGNFSVASSAGVDASAPDAITVSTVTDGVGNGPPPATSFASLAFATGNIVLDNRNGGVANAVVEIAWNWTFDLKALDDLSSVAGIINWQVIFDQLNLLGAQDEIRGVDFGPGALLESQSGSTEITLSLSPGAHLIHTRVLSIGAVVIPEPSTFVSAAIGLIGLAAVRLRARRPGDSSPRSVGRSLIQ